MCELAPPLFAHARKEEGLARQTIVGVAFRVAMLRALGLKRPYEPKPRALHYAGAVRGELLVFAGKTVDFDKTKEELSSTIQIFDQYLVEAATDHRLSTQRTV